MDIKFGTGGFRGVIGDDFIKENIKKIAQAICNLANENNLKKEIIIGYDYRFLSSEASKWIAEVFIANNFKVNLCLTATPSPAIMYYVNRHSLDIGVMITASHNPYIFNGIKVFTTGGYDADVSFTNKLEKMINSEILVNDCIFEKQNNVKFVDGITDYVNNILSFVNVKNNNTKICFDNLNGVGILSIKPLLEKIGVKNTIILNENRDPLFRGLLPNPIEVNLNDLKRNVLENKCDFGFASDSDADRLGIIDEKGHYVSSNEILASLYYYLVKYKGLKGDIVKNCATSNLIDKVASKLGYKCHEVDVGFKNITSKMHEVDALIGGESSGGLTIRNYIHGKDTTFAFSLFLEMVTNLQKPVSEIIKEVYDFAEFHNYVVEDFISYCKEDEERIISYLNNIHPSFSEEIIEFTHLNRNYKFRFKDDKWMLIRLSGTEPVFRIFAEMSSEEEAKNNIEILRKFINGIK